MPKGCIARRPRSGQDRQRRIGLFRAAGKQVVAADHGRAERRPGRHGPRLAGRRGGGRVNGRGGDGQDGVRRGAHQEPALARLAIADLADNNLDLALSDHDDGAARLAFASLGEGHVQRLGRLAARQGAGRAIGL